MPTGGLSCKDLDLVTSRLNFGQLRSLQEAVANEDLHETEKCELVQTWVTKIQNHNQEPTRKVQKVHFITLFDLDQIDKYVAG